MVAIKVKYIPASNFKGSRLKAECGAKSVTISKPDHTHHGEETAFEAVKAFSEKFKVWRDVVWACGYLEKSNEYVFTYICDLDNQLAGYLLREPCGGFMAFRSHPEPMIAAIGKAQGQASSI